LNLSFRISCSNSVRLIKPHPLGAHENRADHVLQIMTDWKYATISVIESGLKKKWDLYFFALFSTRNDWVF